MSEEGRGCNFHTRVTSFASVHDCHQALHETGSIAGLENEMMKTTHVLHELKTVTREDLVALLNQDLAGEYQAIISYVIYSQVIKGAQYMNIASELEKHAAEELEHALIVANQIDYLCGMPIAVPNPVKTSTKAEEMLRFDLENENTTIARYRQRVRQCEALGEYAVAEQIRQILVQEQDHQIALATALGVPVPNVAEIEIVPLPENGQVEYEKVCSH